MLYCYRKVHTQSAKKWLERLHKEKIPVLVCLTFGDKLYAEHMTTSGEHPSVEHMSRVIKSQTTVSRREIICCNGCKYEFHCDFIEQTLYYSLILTANYLHCYCRLQGKSCVLLVHMRCSSSHSAKTKTQS